MRTHQDRKRGRGTDDSADSAATAAVVSSLDTSARWKTVTLTGWAHLSARGERARKRNGAGNLAGLHWAGPPAGLRPTREEEGKAEWGGCAGGESRSTGPKTREGVSFPFSFSKLIFQTNFEMQIQINLKFDFKPHNSKILCSSMNAYTCLYTLYLILI